MLLLDDDAIEHIRARAEAQVTGYHTMINAALREAIARPKGKAADDKPLTVSTLRRILREELQTS
jgi:hypothetical protein